MFTKTDKKKETMRKRIVSQAETIKKLKQENRELAAEKNRLTAEYEKIDNIIAKYSRIISALEEQRNQYIQLNLDIHKLKKKVSAVWQTKPPYAWRQKYEKTRSKQHKGGEINDFI